MLSRTWWTTFEKLLNVVGDNVAWLGVAHCVTHAHCLSLAFDKTNYRSDETGDEVVWFYSDYNSCKVTLQFVVLNERFPFLYVLQR